MNLKLVTLPYILKSLGTNAWESSTLGLRAAAGIVACYGGWPHTKEVYSAFEQHPELKRLLPWCERRVAEAAEVINLVSSAAGITDKDVVELLVLDRLLFSVCAQEKYEKADSVLTGHFQQAVVASVPDYLKKYAPQALLDYCEALCVGLAESAANDKMGV